MACEQARAASGSAVTTPDNATLWYDLQGPATAPVVVFLHGGPGYNAASFMSAVGPTLRLAVQRQLHFASDEGQQRMEASDARSGILACTSRRAVQALVEEGWLNRAQTPLALAGKGVLLAGRKSEAIGEAQIASAARAFDVPVVWFENSGHFVFVEEPERFVSVVEDIVLRGATLTSTP